MLLTTLLALSTLFSAQEPSPPEEKNTQNTDCYCYSATYGWGEASEILQRYPNDGKLYLDILEIVSPHSPGNLFCIKDGKMQSIPFLRYEYTPSQTIQKALAVIPELKLDRQETCQLFDKVIFQLELSMQIDATFDFRIEDNGDTTIFRVVREKKASVNPQTNTPNSEIARRIYLQKERVSTDTNMQLSIYDTTHECEESDPNTTIPTNKELSCFRIQLQDQKCPYYLLFSTSGYWEILPVETILHRPCSAARRSALLEGMRLFRRWI